MSEFSLLPQDGTKVSCPFCGSAHLLLSERRFDFDRLFQVVCTGCKARGPEITRTYHKDPGDAALTSWNTRAEPAPAV